MKKRAKKKLLNKWLKTFIRENTRIGVDLAADVSKNGAFFFMSGTDAIQRIEPMKIFTSMPVAKFINEFEDECPGHETLAAAFEALYPKQGMIGKITHKPNEIRVLPPYGIKEMRNIDFIDGACS